MNISFSSQHQINSRNFTYGSNVKLIKNAQTNDKNHKKGNNGMFINGRGTSLGGKFKKNNILENLMKQKTNLMDSKNAFIERSLETGKSQSSIQKKLESFDKQIEEINKQISQIQLDEQRKTISNKEKSKKNKNSKETSDTNSPNGVQRDPSTDNILNLSSNLSKAKAFSSQRNLMSGEARVLDFEIKTDEKRGLNPVRKRKRLTKLEDNIENITKKLGDQLKDINHKVKSTTQNNKFDNTINKNRHKNIVNNSEDASNDKLLINKQQISANIKHYKDMMNNKDKKNNEKINTTA